ncbi:DUF6390 family protein [Nocardia tengchongensis]|uniref:DUF6390 family protein n=2 Tax=Nocardia tengchongensis TaxID=2055889 RepID=UPI0036CBE31A
MESPDPVPADGTEMFARYAYAPNALGYCGPPDTAGLRGGSSAAVRATAPLFSGAWPYLCVLASLTGIDDPLDARLVESYWLGGGIGAALDPAEFGAALLDRIGPIAGQYWAHLGAGLTAEAAPNHSFHVFGVYPWSRLLDATGQGPALRILDDCRISWGRVIDVDRSQVLIRSQNLTWNGLSLSLSQPEDRSLAMWEDGYAAVPDLEVGDLVATHWNHLCGRLRPEQSAALETSTLRQIRVTNERLARNRAATSAGSTRE